MNKKVKWTVISVTSASLLTFAGLVASNTEKEATNNTTAANSNEWDIGSDSGSQDNFSNTPNSNGSEEFGTDDGEQFFRGHGEKGEQGQYSQDQDQYYQAPSGGFDQGAGSSGASH